MAKRTTKPPTMSDEIALRVEERKEFWAQAGDHEVLMALFEDADEVTFWKERGTRRGERGRVRYRVEATLDKGGHAFNAMSTDDDGDSPGDALRAVLVAVASAYGPRPSWSDWWMDTRKGFMPGPDDEPLTANPHTAGTPAHADEER